MKNKKKIGIALAVVSVALLFGCSPVSGRKSISSKTQVEGLDQLGAITAVAREDGSGTRNVFAELLGFDEKNKETGASDLTRGDAKVADSASNVVAEVAADKSAIGYVSMGALKEATGIKVLAVNDTPLDVETVKKGTYPLSRSFYMAYYETDKELNQEFLRFVRGKGQEFVAEQYVPSAKAENFRSMGQKGSIHIDGSTSVAPLMEMIAEEYMLQNPNAEIEITESDSTKGIDSAIKGDADFAMSSRELKDYEKELLDYEMIAKEGIAVIVNEENPMETITTEQLNQIYTGKISSWQEINGKIDD